MGFIGRISNFIETQYKNPEGLLGMYIGEKMVRQHQPETLWTIKLLDLQPDERLLELGCGAGYAMKLLLERPMVTQMVGLDKSQTVIKSATIRNRKEINRGRAKLMQGNVSQLPFPDGYFTKIFSIHSVYFWDDLSGAMSEIDRVIEPGGKIVITFCNGKNEEIWSSIEQQVIPMMEQTGFKNIELLKGPNSRQFHTAAITGEK